MKAFLLRLAKLSFRCYALTFSFLLVWFAVCAQANAANQEFPTRAAAMAACNAGATTSWYDSNSQNQWTLDGGSCTDVSPNTNGQGWIFANYHHCFRGECDNYGCFGLLASCDEFDYAAPGNEVARKAAGNNNDCGCHDGVAKNDNGATRSSGSSSASGSSMLVGDPINPSNGNSYLQEDDYLGAGKLVFRRFYNSNAPVGATSIGSHWRHNFSQSLVITGSPATSIVVYRPDGKQEVFTKLKGAWNTDPDVTDVLSEVTDSQGSVTAYKLFVTALHHYETFGTTGLLQSISNESGLILSFSYSTTSTPTTIAPSAGLLITVMDPTGRQLGLTYAANHSVQQVTLPDGGTLNYTYDNGGNLTSVQYPDGKTRQYVYNESSLTSGKNFFSALTGIIDEFGARFETTSYDTAGRAISSSLSGGVQSTQVTYSANGTSSVQFPLGVTIVMGFSAPQGVNKVGTVNQYCGPLCGQSWHSRTYDANGNPSGYTDFDGNVTATTYTSLGLLSQQVDAQGQASQRTMNFTWDSTLRVPLSRAVLDNANNTVESGSWKYNATGQTLASCQSDPHVSGAGSYACGSAPNAPSGVQQTSFTYCTSVDGTQCPLVGLLLTVDGPRTDVSDITHYSYYLTPDESGCGTVGGACHRAGDLYQVTDALGHVATMVAYDKNGRLVRSQDSNNVITDLTYTPRGWLKTRAIGGATTTIDYDAVGNVIKITDADGVFIGYTYDAAHRLTDITDAAGNHIHYTLDAAGNKTKEDTYDSGNTLRRTLSRSYNTLGQLTGVTDGLSHTVFNASYTDSYDANGNLVHTADGLGIQRKQGYDALNRLVSTLDNYNGTDSATQNTQATFAYDVLDNLEGVTDPGGLSTTYDYDGLSNPRALHSPDTGTTSFQVDAAGNRIQQTDAKGIVRTTTYDAINRPVTVSYPDSSQNIAYHYDEADGVTGCSGSFPMGRLTRIVETAVTTTYCYDNHGNVTKKTQAQGAQVDTTSYSYTGADRLSSITTPSQTVTQYSRDGAGRVSGVAVTPSGGASQTVVSAISYLPFGPISSYTLGNGQIITRSYDANYQLTDLTSPALNLHFARDVMGNIIGLGNTSGANPAVETYGYDPLYRLAGVNDANGNAIEAYTYSKTGDRLSKVKAGGLATGVYGYQSGTHWLTSIGSAARTYDLNGNTIGGANAGETSGYGYNDRNRLTLVQRNQQTVATYVYNAMGERVAKAVTSPQTINERFTYNEASQLTGEYGTTNRDYIWLDGLPVAVVDSGTTSTINYVHADGLGTPRAISDSAGNTVWQWAYQSNPFGEQSPIGSYVYNLRFPGQYFDAESGLHYNVNRSYEAAIGRYVQSDPIGLAGGVSSFGYALSRPMAFTDPLGLAPKDRWWEFTDREFQRWYHQCWKQSGDPDATRDELGDAHDEWKKRGSPTEGRCWGDPQTCPETSTEQQPEVVPEVPQVPDPDASPERHPDVAPAARRLIATAAVARVLYAIALAASEVL
ncbi:RHS repeat-associated core domain-containing protein [Dyella sp. GSA-30]|uniref:RHS repeat-associated core domain-containing protein n=1 Tax=Dyella sp. GSA-30 TaxID=2994496 RepID=UPI0024925691|nr:RHS repeat-associated core domain-containing protein [Dyella sp. GSA-30]